MFHVRGVLGNIGDSKKYFLRHYWCLLLVLGVDVGDGGL